MTPDLVATKMSHQIQELQAALIRVEADRVRIDHNREVIEVRMEEREKALVIQARLNEVHFESLNNVGKRLMEMQALNVHTEVYRVQHAALEQKVDVVTRMVWVGCGAVMALQFLLHYFVK